MNTATSRVDVLTAEDAMERSSFVIPRRMLVRQAAHLLYRNKSNGAPVVDEQGRYIGMLFPTDVLRWVEAGCPDTAVDPGHACPYQLRGRLVSGDIAEICTLADGSCPFQEARPTTAGRHSEICMRPADQVSPFGDLPKYMTTNGFTVRQETPLPELMREMFDANFDRLVVVDENEQPMGIVSATDILAAIAAAGQLEMFESADDAEADCVPKVLG